MTVGIEEGRTEGDCDGPQDGIIVGTTDEASEGDKDGSVEGT